MTKLFRFVSLWVLLSLFMVGAPTVLAQDVSPRHSDPGWRAFYWNNTDLTGAPVVQLEERDLNFDWGLSSPHRAIYADQFSARWERYIDVTPGTYRFTARMDDGMRVWVDNELIIDQWRQQSVQTISTEKYLGPGHHLIRVEYFEQSGAAIAKLSWTLNTPGPTPTPTPPPTPTPSPMDGWRGEYFNNLTLGGTPALVRNDPEINFSWGNSAPAPEVAPDFFSVRWTRNLDLPTGNYRFSATVDDGARLFVNGHTLIDAWQEQPATTYTGDIFLPGGRITIQMEYFDSRGGASARLTWQRLDDSGPLTDWQGEYFNNRTLAGTPALVRNDRAIDFDWGTGSPANGVIGVDDFSVRWTRRFDLPAGNYRFTTTTDDGVRLILNGQLVISQWREQSTNTASADFAHTGGQIQVQMEYFEARGSALARLRWDRVDTPGNNWSRYRNERYGVEFDYPTSWRSTENDNTRYSGSDGFFVVDATSRTTLATLVQNEISHPLRPYGTNPRVDSLWVGSQEARLILPAADQPAAMRQQAALAVLYPQPRTIGGFPYTIFVLYASEAHLRRMADSLRFLPTNNPPPPTGKAVIVDTNDRGFVKGGNPNGWRSEAEGYGGNLLWSQNNDRARDSYNWSRWYPALQAGRYEVFVYIPDRFTTTSNARYWVSHQGGLTLRALNQSAYSNQWVSLGTYTFRGTQDDYVSLADVTFEQRLSRLIAWDAVKWEPR
ncbi:MAG: hypothetical protein KF832_31730 [Caldilineaceae bacterium]|nr:hypothetical protein [Caldilineaceae bacterium]